MQPGRQPRGAVGLADIHFLEVVSWSEQAI